MNTSASAPDADGPFPCPVCGAAPCRPRPTPLGVLRDCDRCGFVFAAPTLDPSAGELYPEEWAREVMNPTFYYADGEFRPRNVRRMHQLLDRLEPYRRLNRLLDVGCSAAFFLRAARDRGWQVRGVEVSAFGAEYSRAELGIDVFHGTLQEAGFAGGEFDVVVSSHVIEHVADPRGLVREMARVTRPGGAVVVTAPTQLSSPGYKLFGLTSGEAPPRHVSFFSPRTLARVLSWECLRVVHKVVNLEFYQLTRACRTFVRMRPAATPGPPVPPAATAAPTEPMSRWPVRVVKRAANTIAARLDVGDEVTLIAVKP